MFLFRPTAHAGICQQNNLSKWAVTAHRFILVSGGESVRSVC